MTGWRPEIEYCNWVTGTRQQELAQTVSNANKKMVGAGRQPDCTALPGKTAWQPTQADSTEFRVGAKHIKNYPQMYEKVE